MEIPRPGVGDCTEYLLAYVSLPPDGPILETLAAQIDETAALLSAAGEERGEHRYAPGKWTVKEVVGHLADTELVFTYRALRFARGDATPLPGFEQDDWVRHAGCGERNAGRAGGAAAPGASRRRWRSSPAFPRRPGAAAASPPRPRSWSAPSPGSTPGTSCTTAGS